MPRLIMDGVDLNLGVAGAEAWATPTSLPHSPHPLRISTVGEEQLLPDTSSSSTKTHWTMKTHPGGQGKVHDANMSNIACQLCRR